MSETYLKLGSIGTIVGIYTAFVGMIWSFFSYRSYSTVGVIYNFIGFIPHVSWSARSSLLALRLSIVVSELSNFFFWSVATYAPFMVFGILTGIGLYGIRSLKIHKMEVVSLITGVVVAPLVFLFRVLSITNTVPLVESWGGGLLFLTPAPNGGLVLCAQIALLIVFVVFGSTLIVTGEATGRAKAAETSGIISIVVGIASFFVLGLPPSFMIGPGNDLVMLSPMIVLALFAIIFVMMTYSFQISSERREG